MGTLILDNDDTRDLAIRIVDKLVESGLIEDCIDTDDNSEFDAQDIIHQLLNEKFGVKE
tara:strand:+ start:1306 stop:1482 length:177 start_codon:yes stop_codon:yes gene_type:complete